MKLKTKCDFEKILPSSELKNFTDNLEEEILGVQSNINYFVPSFIRKQIKKEEGVDNISI